MKIDLLEAFELICSGHVIAVPTETVYGWQQLLMNLLPSIKFFH